MAGGVEAAVASADAAMFLGIGAGGAVAATVKPDLRSWHMLPARFSALRIVLPAGTYQISTPATEGLVVLGNHEQPVEIRPGKKTFVSLRSFKRGL